jgi:hypothetical protein
MISFRLQREQTDAGGVRVERKRRVEPMAKSKLSLYQRKRDFTKTAEPTGKTNIAPAE